MAKTATKKRRAPQTSERGSARAEKSSVWSDLISSDAGRLILAEALVAAATAAAAVLRRGISGSDKERRSREHEPARDLAGAAAGALGEFVSEAARTLLPQSGEGRRGARSQKTGNNR